MPPEAQLFLILLILVFFWFVVMRPARVQQRRMQQLQRDLQVGDEVVLSSGIFGSVQSLDEGRVQLEVSPGVVLTVARQAVVRRVDAEATDEPTDEATEPDPDDPNQEKD